VFRLWTTVFPKLYSGPENIPRTTKINCPFPCRDSCPHHTMFTFVQLWNKLPEEVVSASSVSAFISRLSSMHVSFLMFWFSAVCFFINVSFRAVVGALWAFLSSRHSSALYCFYCIASVLMNKIFIFIHSTRGSLAHPSPHLKRRHVDRFICFWSVRSWHTNTRRQATLRVQQ